MRPSYGTWRERPADLGETRLLTPGDRLGGLPSCQDDAVDDGSAQTAVIAQGRAECVKSPLCNPALQDRLGEQREKAVFSRTCRLGHQQAFPKPLCARDIFRCVPAVADPRSGRDGWLRPFLGKPTRCAIHNRRPPRLGRALSPRRRHVQFNVEKSGAPEGALVAPIPVN